MGKFKRFCMIVFVVAAVLGIGVLAALRFADVVTPAFTQQATKYTDDTRRQHQTKPVPAHVVE